MVHDGAMDRVDHAIIDHLRRDGRMSNTDLTDQVRLSPSACLRRVRQLERDGVITGYRAQIDPTRVGRGFEVVVHAEIVAQDRLTIEAVETRIAAMPEVVECTRMFGNPDYLIRVAVADATAYESFYMAQLAGLHGVGRLSTQMVMRTVTPGHPQ